MITKEDIETRMDEFHKEHCIIDDDNCDFEYEKIIHELLKERDEALRCAEAYREVAIGWVTSETETRTNTKEMCIKQVDAEAESILKLEREAKA